MEKIVEYEGQIVINLRIVKKFEGENKDDLEDVIDNYNGQLAYWQRNNDLQSIINEAEDVNFEMDLEDDHLSDREEED